MAARRLHETLTIRLPTATRRSLLRRARRLDQTPSHVARVILERGLAEDEAESAPTLGDLTGHLLGTIASRAVPAGQDARESLAEWGPDRRE
jgi:hypothetical protein